MTQEQTLLTIIEKWLDTATSDDIRSIISKEKLDVQDTTPLEILRDCFGLLTLLTPATNPREQAQKAYKLLATDNVSLHVEGLRLLQKAREDDLNAVQQVESEIEED